MPTSPDHIDRLIAALPVHRLAPVQRNTPAMFPTWRWPLPATYNGFSGVERVRGWQVSRWLEAAGILARPQQCGICRSDDQVNAHGEDYYAIGRAPALCKACHVALHRRRRNWEHWRDLICRHTATGDEWFCVLERDPIDLSGHLRSGHSYQVADLMALLDATLQCCDALPGNLMPHPDLLSAHRR